MGVVGWMPDGTKNHEQARMENILKENLTDTSQLKATILTDARYNNGSESRGLKTALIGYMML